MDHTAQFDLELISKYDQSGPRYTSYPTAVQFHEGFDEEAYRRVLVESNANASPLSLYFHI
ncbi:MAG: coproporphyrinogen III oxidase, partial [Chromatiales bacterium]